ncbi:MAG: hypothetical protein IKV21_02285 [Clostridia bacterium]|nr:hypothetical protein [Clostridia bacterium]
MICKNCANIFSDDLTACPECDTPVSVAEKKDNSIDDIVSLALGEFEDISSFSGEEEQIYDEEPSQQEEAAQEEEFVPPVYNEEEKAPEVKKAAPEIKAEKPQVLQQRERPKMKKMSRKEKDAYNFIIALMAVVFACMAALAGISIGTDAFEKDEDSVMAVALSGLSSSETEELEDYLSKISIVAYTGYNRDIEVVVDVMEFLRPYDAGGLYSRFYKAAELTVNEPDPNARFFNENGDYSFYALDAEKVDRILYTFGFDINHNVNEKNFYYYDGKYYFANTPDYSFSSAVEADVSSSKRIQDGSYYVECSFYDAGTEDSKNSYLKAYIILDMVSDAQEGYLPWRVKRISHKAIFDSTGFMIKDENDKNELSYTIEKQTIQAVAEDGTVYAEYNLEYPYFKGDSEGEKAVNSLFAELVNSYTLKSQDIQSDYKKFIRRGGDKEELPFVTHSVARVTYNRNGYISIVEGLSEYQPQTKKSKEAAKENGETAVTLPERTIEGYIIDVETGDFLTKKELIDAEYHLVYEVIYRIYEGYDYESLLKGEDAAIGIPKDKDETGKSFYESASALSESGFIFCRMNPKGYTETVLIPYSSVNFFDKDFSKSIKDKK